MHPNLGDKPPERTFKDCVIDGCLVVVFLGVIFGTVALAIWKAVDLLCLLW